MTFINLHTIEDISTFPCIAFPVVYCLQFFGLGYFVRSLGPPKIHVTY